MTPETKIFEKERQLSERRCRADLPGTMTDNEKDAYEIETAVLESDIRRIRTSSAALAAAPDVSPDTEWNDNLNAWRKTLCDELLSLPARVRTDFQRGTQINLKLSIAVIDRGTGVLHLSGYGLETLRLGQLMRESGYKAAPPIDENHIFGKLPWYGSLDEVEQRIAKLKRDREIAQAALDEAMLDDDAREELAAARTARAKELNARPQIKTRGDGSRFEKWPGGRIVELDDVTTS